MGWHSDNEKELGVQPVIASISLGVPRTLQFRQKGNPKTKTSIVLESGSLLLMQGNTQEDWQHQIAKTKKVKTPRINLTFRIIQS
jgi:alkylated DNA repair dioxygenase AlkB